MHKLIFMMVFLTALAVSVPAVTAEQKIITAQDPDAILNVARGYGMANLTRDNQGDPAIEGRMDGKPYNIFFYGCTDGADCQSLQFETGWDEGAEKISLDTINEWNRRKLFVQSYKNKDGYIRLQMSMILRYGVTEKNLEAYFGVWASSIVDFQNEILK